VIVVRDVEFEDPCGPGQDLLLEMGVVPDVGVALIRILAGGVVTTRTWAVVPIDDFLRAVATEFNVTIERSNTDANV
jgi:hypothetical protein